MVSTELEKLTSRSNGISGKVGMSPAGGHSEDKPRLIRTEAGTVDQLWRKRQMVREAKSRLTIVKVEVFLLTRLTFPMSPRRLAISRPRPRLRIP